MTVDNLLFREVRHHRLRHFVVGLGPKVDHFVVLLALSYQAGGVLALDFFHFIGSSTDDLSFFIRDNEVVNTDGNAGNSRVSKTGVHQLVSEDHGLFQTNHAVALVDQLGDRLFLHWQVDDVVRQTFWHNLIQQRTADSGVDDTGVGHAAAVTVVDGFVDPHFDLGVQCGFAGTEHTVNFLQVSEYTTFALGVDRFTGHVVQTQYNVLRRNDDWLTVGGRQDVVGRHHQRTRFQLSFQRQRYVNSHLVTIEVGVICRTNQRVQLDRFTFDQNRVKRLDTQTVQGWCTVQQYRVFADNFVQDIPNDSFFALNHFLSGFDGGGEATQLQFAVDERFEQFQCHFLRQTTLVQTQVWTYGDNGTTRVVDTFTQQVLTETTLFTFNHVCQRFQRTLVRAGDCTTATAVIQQSIYRFLQHTFFVTYDDIWRSQIQQAFQTVVTVDNATVQIVQIRRCETAAVQRNQWTQVWRQYRQHGQDHPLWFVTRLNERFQQLNTLGQFLTLGFGVGFVQLFTQLFAFRFQVHVFQQGLNSFCAHLGVKLITKLFQRVKILLFSQDLAFFEVSHAAFDYHIASEVQDTFDITQWHIQQQTDARRQRFQEPDMCSRGSEFDMAHTLTAYFSLGHFNATLLADHAAMF